MYFMFVYICTVHTVYLVLLLKSFYSIFSMLKM